MTDATDLFLGEWTRSLDERHRLSLPPEWADLLAGDTGECTLAKERPGCVSLWNTSQWQSWLAGGVELLRTKLRGDRLRERVGDVQQLGRLLSTRHRTVPIAGRGRLALPDSFREFLGVEPGGDVLVVGAAVCVELWRPQRWGEHIGEQMPGFRQLFDELTK
jgi:MraZ protein